MQLALLDWLIILAFFGVSIGIGIWAARTAGKSSEEFFLSGRNMPWWLLGISMVATTFAADTPNLVTQIVREDGIAGNWVWWSFLLTALLTVFVYAKLWRRTGISTDLAFYELRYSGKLASFLRGFRAIYLGVFFNIAIMATVSLAAIKIGAVILGFKPWETLLIASVVTLIYSTIGGLKGVLYTDLFQFVLAIGGSIWACVYLVNLPEVGGISNVMETLAPTGKTNLFPDFSEPSAYLPLFAIPLLLQWWSAWYPGAEPGGGGYIAQRMLSAKDPKHATKATLFFTFAHYALRPWPWIIIALASLLVFPDLGAIQEAFPNVAPETIKNDIAYPAMITLLPVGLAGIVIASLIAAYMSTISTHLNWGSSYVVNDVYQRFIRPSAKEKELVMVGRISTAVLLFFSAVLALFLEDALKAFKLLLQIGAGTGLLFLLRWFWRRINPYSEVAAMLFSFVVALIFHFNDQFGFEGSEEWKAYAVSVAITTFGWVGVTLITKTTDVETWKQFKIKSFSTTPVFSFIIAFFAGLGMIFGSLFSVGWYLTADYNFVLFAIVIVIVSLFGLTKVWKKIND